jgi:hypothetical protein
MSIVINRGRDVSVLAGSAGIEFGLRVKITAVSQGKATVGLAGAGELHHGTMLEGTANAAYGPCALRGLGLTVMIAAVAIAVNDRVYGAANGKVSNVPVGPCLGLAVTASGADGDQLVVQETYGNGNALTVSPKVADYAVTTQDHGTLFTNTGAAGTVVFSLPAATVGLEFQFAVEAAQALRIDPSGAETISLPETGVPGAAGKYLGCATPGCFVRLVCAKAGTWSAYGQDKAGVWAAEP